MNQHHWRAPVSIALDVHGARADGNAKEIGVDGKKPEVVGAGIGVPNRGIS
jgi:hypothetical protein